MLMLHSIQGFLIRAIRVIRGSLCLLSRHGFHSRQEIPEFSVVDLHAVIQVEADPLVGIMAKLFIKTHCPGGLPSVLQVSV